MSLYGEHVKIAMAQTISLVTSAVVQEGDGECFTGCRALPKERGPQSWLRVKDTRQDLGSSSQICLVGDTPYGQQLTGQNQAGHQKQNTLPFNVHVLQWQ